MKNLENIYDEQISPLMTQIIDICKQHNLPMFASFEYSEDAFCNTLLRFDGHPVFDYFSAISQSSEQEGINIDKFMLWVMRGAKKRGHTSVILSQLDIPTTPEKLNK